ncbi:hypothetical protein [Aliikangiella sp. IMCC44359]|uniref:hypothetical protein n=1 Tax=Aliikangiella sp. IMCC44359 TaxID=3459125 RepID=UPI00403AB390
MSNHEKPISVAEAQSTLESLAKIEQETNTVLRAPLWLNFIIACSYGMMTFSWASTRHDNLWMLGLIISTIVFLLAIAFYLYNSRLLGVKPKLLPKSKSEFKFHLFAGLFFGLVFALTRVLSTNDIWWASYVGGAINALVLAYSLHHYPSGDFKRNTSRHE